MSYDKAFKASVENYISLYESLSAEYGDAAVVSYYAGIFAGLHDAAFIFSDGDLGDWLANQIPEAVHKALDDVHGLFEAINYGRPRRKKKKRVRRDRKGRLE